MIIAVIRVPVPIGNELKEGTFVPERIPGGDFYSRGERLTARQTVTRFFGDPYKLEVVPAHDFAGYNIVISMKEPTV